MLCWNFMRSIGVGSAIALLSSPVMADDADVQVLKQEVAALQKKLNVLEKQEQINRAQQQAAIQSWETVTSGKDDEGAAAAWKPFGVKITFGGYAALEGVFRDKNEATSIGSNFATIPFDNIQQAHISELRATAQQSRLSMLAEANVSDHQKYASYLEFDFLGAAPTANSKEFQQLHAATSPILFDWRRQPGWLALLGRPIVEFGHDVQRGLDTP